MPVFVTSLPGASLIDTVQAVCVKGMSASIHLLTKQKKKKKKKDKRIQGHSTQHAGPGVKERLRLGRPRRSGKCHEALLYSRAPLLAASGSVCGRGRSVTGGSGSVCACMPER